MALRQASIAVSRTHVRAARVIPSIVMAQRTLSAQAARVVQTVREVPITPSSSTTTAAAGSGRVIGVAESKGRCIGELPTDVILPNTFNIAKSWSAADVPLSNVTYTFGADVARELDAFVLSQCYTSDGLEKLLAHGIPENELKLTKASVGDILAHIDRVGFLVIKAASPTNGLIPPYTHYSSVLISSLLGNLLPQDGEGRKIIGVFQQGNKTMETGARYHQTRQGGSLHTDNVASTRPWDLLFMSCVAPALVGGESIICSSVTLYNFLKQTAPAALETLSKPFIWECRGFAADDYFMAPIFFYKTNPSTGAKEPAIRYLRQYLESAAKRHNRPLTDEQLWAFDVLDAAMEMSQHQFRFFLDVGDHLVMSASQTLHGRTAFIDHTATSNGASPARNALQQPNHSPIPSVIGSRFLTRCWISFPSTPVTPILSAPIHRGITTRGSTLSSLPSFSSIRYRSLMSHGINNGGNKYSKQDFHKRPVASNTTSPGCINANQRLGLRLSEVVNTMMSSPATPVTSSSNSSNKSVIIFDKDGTLLCFHSMWGTWIEKQAAQLESITGLTLADKIYDAVGYDAMAGRVRGVDSPLAYATMPTIKSLFERVVLTELQRNSSNNSMSDTSAASIAYTAVSRAWTDDHDLTRVRSTTGSSHELLVLLTSLRDAGFKLAICTADNRVPTMASLSALGIAHMFDMIVCGDDGLPAKPNAAIAHHICHTLATNPSLSFIIGDTKADMSLGVSSGLQSVGVLTGVGSAADLAAATYILPSVADIIPLVPAPYRSVASSSVVAKSSYDGRVVTSSVSPSYARHMSTSSASSSSLRVDRPMRGIKDVWKLVPNQIDYARIVLGMSPLVIPASHYHWAAGAYLFSHALDQVDGRVARKLKQQSDFGMMLDYTTDIVTQAAMFMKICSIAPYYVIPAAIVVAVESAGMVLAIQASASGRYWKNTDNNTPIILRDYVMKNGVYTPLGDSLVFGHQAFVATTFMCLYNDAFIYNGLWWALLPVSLANFTANSAIVYELCRKWQEPYRS